MRDYMNETGLMSLIRHAAVDVWRANRDRHEPDELYDDAFTLSVVSTRNLANRLFEQISSDKGWPAKGVSVLRQSSTTVVGLRGVDLRFVKAPHRTGRRPNFDTDFDWARSEFRFAAAMRNRAAYHPPPARADHASLFEIEQADAPEAAARCRDAFVVWAAELESGLTAGWLGLPTTSADRWLAVLPLWWDEQRISAAANDILPNDAGRDPRGSAPPVPDIRLKHRRGQGIAQ